MARAETPSVVEVDNAADRRLLEAAVMEAGAFHRRSCMISAPTNTGKSYVAQKLLVQYLEVQRPGSTSVYLCPYKALAEEVAWSLTDLIEARVREVVSAGAMSPLHDLRPVVSTGDYTEPVDFSAVPLLVATYEKFAALIARRRDFRPFVVVADEVQLVGDEIRGPRAEFVISALAEGRSLGRDVLFYPISAVLGNAEVLAGWMDIPLVQGDESHRLVPLTIKAPCIHEDDDQASRCTRRVVVAEVRAGRQVLVLDPSRRRNSEARAEGLKQAVGGLLTVEDRARSEELALRLERQAPYLRPLAELVRHGVAYHHAGLDVEARRLLERSFRREALPKVICCSPTLAAGVNLPASRVVLRNPIFQAPRRPLTASECLNVLGRAGRYIPERGEQQPGVANICLTEGQRATCAQMLEAVAARKVGDVRSQIPRTLSHVMDFILWSIQLGGPKSLENIVESYRRTLWAFERGSETRPPAARGRLRTLLETSLDFDGRLGTLEIAERPRFESGAIEATIRSGGRLYKVSIPPTGLPSCDGPQWHPSARCKHVRKVLLKALTITNHGRLPIAAFDAAIRLVPEFREHMPPERVLQFALGVLDDWGFVVRGNDGYDVTPDGEIAAASWLPKPLVHALRERIGRSPTTADPDTVLGWALEDARGIVANNSDLQALPQCLDLWLAGGRPERLVACMRGERGFQDFLNARDHLVTILRTYTQFAQAREKHGLLPALLHATRKVQYGVPDAGLPLACMQLRSLNRDRVLTLVANGITTIEMLADPTRHVELQSETGDRFRDAVEEAQDRLRRISEFAAVPLGPERDALLRRAASEFGMDPSDLFEFGLGPAAR